MTRESIQLDLTTLGSTGLRQFGGFIADEHLAELEGPAGANTYRQMGDNDGLCSGILFVFDKLLRKVTWNVQEASSAGFDKEAADFGASCLHDMSQPLTDIMSEIGSFAQYGYSVHEIVYKRRAGNSPHKAFRSKYRDGRIGWRGLPIRSQDTIQRWHFDPSGDILGFDQSAPPRFEKVTIPICKCLHFRTQTHKNNPEGRSIFRGAYQNYYTKRQVSFFESVGIERDLAGIAVGRCPERIMDAKAGPAEKAQYQSMVDMVTNLRRNTFEGICLPSTIDPTGTGYEWDIKLLTSGGTRQINVDAVIQRLDQRIAMSVMADFLLMGQTSSSTGSFAMHTDKSQLFILALESMLDTMAATMTQGLERLIKLNGMRVSDYPQITHTKIQQPDVASLADSLSKLSQSGMPIFPNPALERFIHEAAGLPPPLELEGAVSDADIMPAPDTVGGEDAHVEELHDASGLADADAELALASLRV